jgi:multisubunit Na+/H+ antiporter MnhB subunit
MYHHRNICAGNQINKKDGGKNMRKEFTVVVFCVFFAFLFFSLYDLHEFGEPPSEMDDYIIQNAQNETGANNVVTSVVFDYRGYDTLGEATVLFTAIAGVMILFRKGGKHEE